MGVRPSKNIPAKIDNFNYNHSTVLPSIPRANHVDDTTESEDFNGKPLKSKKKSKRKKSYADQMFKSLQGRPFPLPEVEKDQAKNRSGSEEEPDANSTAMPRAFSAESRGLTIRACDLCDRLNLNSTEKSRIEAQIKAKRYQIDKYAIDLRAQLKLEEEALEYLVTVPLAHYQATEESILEQRRQNPKPDPNRQSHFYRIQGPHYCTEASCNTCGRIVALSPYLTQLPKECYDLIYQHLIFPLIPNQPGVAFCDGDFSRLRMTCKSIYNKFIAWAPSACDWKLHRCQSRQSSDSSYSAFSTLTMELKPTKELAGGNDPYPYYQLVRVLLSGPMYNRPVSRYFSFYKQPADQKPPIYAANQALLDSVFYGKIAVLAVTQNCYGFATTRATSVDVVAPIAQVYTYHGYVDGSCVAQDSIVYVALKDSEEAREGERIVAIGEEKAEARVEEIDLATEEASECNTSAREGIVTAPRSRFVCRPISELKEGDRLLSSFTGGASDLTGTVALESKDENTESATACNNDDAAPILLSNAVTSVVRLVTRKTVAGAIPIVRIDDEFLITRGHPLLREGEWTRPDEAWPVIESHVDELFNVYLEPHSTFVVGRNRWICGGLGGDYGRVAMLHPENDAKFGRGFKKRYQAHLAAADNESIESK